MSSGLTHVSFDAALSEEFSDDGTPPGADLARAIHSGLARRGVDCDAIEANDYAHSFGASTSAGGGLVMIGHVGDDDGRQWLVFVEPSSSGLIRRRRSDVGAIVAALHETVVHDIAAQPQWFTELQWNDPTFGRGAPEPDGA